MKSARRATLDGVARLAGVSLGSASRALSVPGQVKPATLVKVRQAVAQASHEYRPGREIDVVRAIVERGVDAIVFVGTGHF